MVKAPDFFILFNSSCLSVSFGRKSFIAVGWLIVVVKNEERNQQESQIHHWRKVNACRKFLPFLNARPFFMSPPDEVSISAISHFF